MPERLQGIVFSCLAVSLAALAIYTLLPYPAAIGGSLAALVVGACSLLIAPFALRGTYGLHVNVFLPILGLALVATTSLALNPVSLTRLWGAGMEIGTYGSMILFLAAAMCAAVLRPSSALMRRSSYVALIACVGVLAIFVVVADRPDARPSLSATTVSLTSLYVESPTHMLFGAGPGGTHALKERYRSLEFNASPLWNYTTGRDHSTVSAIAINFGALGTCMYALLIAALALRAWQTRRDMRAAFAPACGALLLVAHAASAPGVSPWVATAFILGLCMRSDSSRVTHALRLTLCILLCAVGISLTYVGARQTIAAVYAARASGHDLPHERVFALSSAAARMWPVTQYSIAISRAAESSAMHLLKLATGNTDIFKRAQLELMNAAHYAEQAASRSSMDFETWHYKAGLFARLEALGYPDAAAPLDEALDQAEKLSPMHPDVPFIRASRAARDGDVGNAKQQLEEALWRKPDYAPALELRAELDTSCGQGREPSC